MSDQNQTRPNTALTPETSGQGTLLSAVVVHSPAANAPTRTITPSKPKLSIGRGDSSDFQIEDGRMSRIHASFEYDASNDSVQIVDQASSNGTFVNGARTARETIHIGDVIRLGDTLLVIEEHRLAERTKDETSSLLKGRSPAMVDLRHSIRKVAPTELTVLAIGETGTGKEVLAKEVHALSNRSGPMVDINCATIPEHLAESTLFGHVKGAFTGATQDRKGLFVEAHGGTLFLDEIGELPGPMQSKLLRVLQDFRVTAVGATRARVVDVRLVAATNKDIRAAVNTGEFRADLLARLEEWPINTPPLRERRGDICALFEHFMDRPGIQLGASAAEALLIYDWPFNVREVTKLVKRLQVALPDTHEITLDDLPQNIAENLRVNRSARPAKEAFSPALTADSTSVGKEEVIDGLRRARGNVSRAAKLLGVGRKTIYRRLEEYNIDPAQYR